jgi:hypothetical protein
MQNYVERDGEILPAYNGVNQPRYSGQDTEMPHEFPAAELEADNPEVAPVDGPYIPPERRYWRDNVPTEEEKAIGRTAVKEARKALEDSRHKPEEE